MKGMKTTVLATLFMGLSASMAFANPSGNFTYERLEPQMGRVEIDPVSETMKKAWKEMGGEVATESSGASSQQGNSSSSGDRTENNNSSDEGGNTGSEPGGNSPQ